MATIASETMIAYMMSVVEALVQVYVRRHVRKVIINISKKNCSSTLYDALNKILFKLSKFLFKNIIENLAAMKKVPSAWHASKEYLSKNFVETFLKTRR